MLCYQAGGSREMRESAEWKLSAAPAVSDAGEGVRVGQAAPLHGPGVEQSGLGRWQLVIALVVLLLVFLLQVHLAAPEGVQGEAGPATAGCGWGRGVVLSKTWNSIRGFCCLLGKKILIVTWYASFWRHLSLMMQSLHVKPDLCKAFSEKVTFILKLVLLKTIL